MKKQLVLLSLCLITITVSAQTNIGGVFINNTTLTLANSPYRAINHILVPQGVTVLIEPGVIIYFNQGIFWQVDGELRAIGTAAQPIKFTKHSSATGWAGFWFTDLSVDYDSANGNGSVLSHCIIEYEGHFNLPNNQDAWSIWIIQCAPLISNCEIRNFYTGVLIYNSSASAVNCSIHNGLYFPVGVYNHNNPLLAIVNHNIIYNINNPNGNDNAAITLWGGAQFIGNCIHDMGDSMAVRVASNNVEIDSNNFINCRAALAIYGGYDSTLRITNNIFYNNSVNLLLTGCERAPVISHNNFSNYIYYHIFVDGYYNVFGTYDCPLIITSYTMNLQNNYWGGLTSSQMDMAIWDYNDDFVTKVIADYSAAAMQPFNLPFQEGCNNLTYLQEQNLGEFFSVFPNPFTSFLSITIPEQNINHLSITIKNIFGQTVFSKQPETLNRKPETSFDLSFLPQGIYLVEVIADGERMVKKVVKQ